MISRYFAFLIIEYKKALRCICHMLFSITLSIGLILGGIAGAGLLLYHSGLLDPVKVGVVVADESRSLNIAINMLESMESFTSVCEIVTIPDEDTALSMLESRELASIVVLPPHFYSDLVYGTNTPARVVSSEHSLLESDLFREILRDGVLLIDTGEAAIYAVNDTWEKYDTGEDFNEMNQSVTMDFINAVLLRDRLFKAHRTSMISFPILIELGLLSVFPLLFGLNFGFFYTSQDYVVEQKLRLYGMRPKMIALAKIFVMGSTMWILAAGLLFAGTHIIDFLPFAIPVYAPSAMFYLGLLPMMLSVAAFFHLLYSHSKGDRSGGGIWLILTIIMVLLSGIFLPVSCLPKVLQNVSAFLPLTWWSRYVIGLATGHGLRAALGVCALIFCIGWGGGKS